MSLDVTSHSDILLVTINNPARRNALTLDAFRGLAGLWSSPETADMRCIVITGQGDAFCSGADLSAGLANVPGIDDLVDAAFLKTRTYPVPIVAAIKGACVAGGLELALACDIRLCSETAKFGLPEARWGIFPAGGGATRLADEIGYAQASRLLLSGSLIDAEEAYRIGLVSGIVDGAALLDEAMALARNIANNSPEATRAIKQYLGAARRPTEQLMKLERQLTHAVRESPDAVEGVAAFLNKRAPRYARDRPADAA